MFWSTALAPAGTSPAVSCAWVLAPNASVAMRSSDERMGGLERMDAKDDCGHESGASAGRSYCCIAGIRPGSPADMLMMLSTTYTLMPRQGSAPVYSR